MTAKIFRPISIFAIVLSASVLFRIWFMLQPALEWWDSAIYIGIGKHIYTGGQLGLFEIFRPLMWPIIIGGFWKIGIDPNIAGKVIVVLSSAGILTLVYLIGESMKKYAGAFSALLLATVPIFFQFSIIPLTDIPSAFCSLLAVWLILNKRFLLAGLAVGFSFSLRFPQAIFVLPIILFLLFQTLKTKAWREFFENSLKFAAGACIFIVPYLAFAQIAYGNALLPVTLGSKIVNGSSSPENADHLYYMRELLKQNFFFFLSYIALISTLFYRRLKIHSTAILLALCFLIVGIYFSQVAHKEVRYSLGFVSYATILSGYALAFILEKISKKSVRIIILTAGAIIIIFTMRNFYKNNSALPPYFYNVYRFERFFNDYPGTRVVTNFPMIAGLSDIKIDEIADSWTSALDAYSRRKSFVDYIMIDSCLMNCQGDIKSCEADQTALLDELNAKEQLAFSDSIIGNCQLLVFKMKK